jgi:hypothetical protein
MEFGNPFISPKTQAKSITWDVNHVEEKYGGSDS